MPKLTASAIISKLLASDQLTPQESEVVKEQLRVNTLIHSIADGVPVDQVANFYETDIGDQNDLRFEQLDSGEAPVISLSPGSANAPTSVVVADRVITITARSLIGNIQATAAEIVAAINGDSAAGAIVRAGNKAGSDGSGAMHNNTGPWTLAGGITGTPGTIGQLCRLATAEEGTYRWFLAETASPTQWREIDEAPPDFGDIITHDVAEFAPGRALVTDSTLQAVAGARYSISNSGLCTITDPATGTTGQSYTVIVGAGTAKWSSGATYQPSHFEIIRYCTATNTWSTLTPTLSDGLTLAGTLSVPNPLITDSATKSNLKSALGLAGIPMLGALYKTDRLTAAFEVNSGAIRTSQNIAVCLPTGVIVAIASATAAPLDTGSFDSGTDYAIHCKSDSTLASSASFTPPAGGVLIGGFHYAPGSNAYIAENTTTFYGDGPSLARSGNFQVSTGNFYYTVPGGTRTYKASSVHDLSAGVVPANTWALYRFGIASGGTITVYPAAKNATTGYSTEALAIAARPAVGAGERAIGYVTVCAAAAATFTPGTDALVGGTGGNVAQFTRYYSETSNGPSINPYSIWDRNFRPSCPDPRGMSLINGKFWMDIYLTNTRPDLYGTSAYNKTIADGVTRAARPVSLGGKSDGTVVMPDHSFWSAEWLLSAYGKSLPSVDELQDATQGATQGSSIGFDPINTTYHGGLTSMFGLVQCFGTMWTWATDAGSDNDKKALFGGYWAHGGTAGSRYVYWSLAATFSDSGSASRGRSDHMIA